MKEATGVAEPPAAGVTCALVGPTPLLGAAFGVRVASNFLIISMMFLLGVVRPARAAAGCGARCGAGDARHSGTCCCGVSASVGFTRAGAAGSAPPAPSATAADATTSLAASLGGGCSTAAKAGATEGAAATVGAAAAVGDAASPAEAAPAALADVGDGMAAAEGRAAATGIT